MELHAFYERSGDGDADGLSATGARGEGRGCARELPGTPTRETSNVKAFDRFIDAELIANQIRPFVSEQNVDEPVLVHVLGAWWERSSAAPARCSGSPTPSLRRPPPPCIRSRR